MASPTINTLTSFSGADMVATFANKVIGELQQISWAVQRDKAPVFTMGCPDARSFSRGKRGLAGSMSFAVFDHDSLVASLQSVWDEIAPVAMFTAAGNMPSSKTALTEDFSDILDMIGWNKTTSEAALEGEGRDGYGMSFGAGSGGNAYTSEIAAQRASGSNNTPVLDDEGNFVDHWRESDDDIFVPAGFTPIRGENIVYADTLPPSTINLAA